MSLRWRVCLLQPALKSAWYSFSPNRHFDAKKCALALPCSCMRICGMLLQTYMRTVTMNLCSPSFRRELNRSYCFSVVLKAQVRSIPCFFFEFCHRFVLPWFPFQQAVQR
jgi:hypothetical protein